MKNSLKKIKDPKNRTLLILYLTALRIKEAIKGIKSIHVFVIVITLFFTTIILNSSTHQFTTNILRLAILGIVVYVMLIFSSVIRPPTWEKQKLNKWDSPYFSDLFIFTFAQLVFGTQATLLAKKYNLPIVTSILLSFFYSVAVLLFIKIYGWLGWGRKRD